MHVVARARRRVDARAPLLAAPKRLLVARRDIRAGQEVTVSETAALGAPEEHPARLEATFDGGAREVRGHRVAGAGAVGRRGRALGLARSSLYLAYIWPWFMIRYILKIQGS